MTDEFSPSRRKTLAALGAIGASSAGAVLGTSALFSDEETFENDRLTAGTLDMKVAATEFYADGSADEAEHADVTADGDDLVLQFPSGEGQTARTITTGDFGGALSGFVLCDNPGYVWLTDELRAASENGVTEPEADDPGEDQVEGTGEPALEGSDPDGETVELLDAIQVAFVDHPSAIEYGAIGVIGVESQRRFTHDRRSPNDGDQGPKRCISGDRS